MGIENHTKLYLCCQKHRKPFYTKKMVEVYHSPFLLMDSIIKSDKMVCIGKPQGDMVKEVLQARMIGIDIDFLDENTLTAQTKKEITYNKIGKKKKMERKREHGFEL